MKNPMILPKVDCSRGAPMGRMTILPLAPTVRTKLRMVKLKLSDYNTVDSGGAYWGNGLPLYWAKSQETYPTKFTTGYNTERIEPIQIFLRANNRADARNKILAMLPNAKFYR